jgi:cytochrome c-type biogenesis protein CcmH/NrfF
MSVIFTKEKEKRTLLAGLLALLVMALMAMPAFAQAPAPDDETYHIAKKLNCPTCAGRNLADCPTDTCTQWKNEIRAQLDQGKSSEEVVDYFEARFGSTVLQEPPKEGSTAILWAAPVGAAVVFFIGAIIVMMRVSKRNTPAMAAATPAPASADPFVSQLEEDVKKSA